jgi:ABC-2 type transport system ATP-binding protein
MENIIETRELTKKFGAFTAVDTLSLNVKKGEIYGFLGLNGAGKTTTIRMLLGMVRPTSGACFLNGRPVRAGGRELWNSIGYLVEIPYSYPDLTVWENLEISRRLRLFSDPKLVGAAIEKLRLGPYRDRKAKHLSLGNAQRLGLAKAIMHAPDILILDEPANGLDPAGIVEIRELLSSLAHGRGVTVFISSHILDEVAKFATRIGIIHEGKRIRELDIGQLEKHRHRRLLVDTRDNGNAEAVLAGRGIAASVGEKGRLEITDPRALENPENINAALVHAGYPPTLLKVEEEDLESYFLRTIGGN